jgi:hypothetical protein
MPINVYHASDEAIAAAIDFSSAPVVAPHHGLRAINDIPRNMPDALLKKLAAKGGVIGFPLGSEPHNRQASTGGRNMPANDFGIRRKFSSARLGSRSTSSTRSWRPTSRCCPPTSR